VETPIVIEAALNGGRSRTEHSGIPLTPDEVTREAVQCFEAGACVAHIHARAKDGGWSADPEWYREAIRSIRAAAAEMLISITSIRPAGTPVESLIGMLEALAAEPAARPDLISVNLGHIAEWDPQSGETAHFPNDFSDVTRLLKACVDLGIVPELGVMGFGFLSNAVMLREAGLLPNDPWFLVELDSPGYGRGPQVIPATVENYDALSTALRSQFPSARWAAHGNGSATFAVLRRAIATGAHVRVGFEDTVLDEEGRWSAGNAEQMRWAVDVAGTFGRGPASPDQARQIIGC
jgi:3-keto-5-aminohexanoate cleavage enzyme